MKLKKCPFCKAEIQEYEKNCFNGNYTIHHFCNYKMCGYERNKKITVQVSVYAETIDELVNLWNNRKGVK